MRLHSHLFTRWKQRRILCALCGLPGLTGTAIPHDPVVHSARFVAAPIRPTRELPLPARRRGGSGVRYGPIVLHLRLDDNLSTEAVGIYYYDITVRLAEANTDATPIRLSYRTSAVQPPPPLLPRFLVAPDPGLLLARQPGGPLSIPPNTVEYTFHDVLVTNPVVFDTQLSVTGSVRVDAPAGAVHDVSATDTVIVTREPPQ